MALTVMCQRSHHRNNAFTDETAQEIPVHLLHIAYKAIVNLFHRAFHRTDHIHIRTRQTKRIHATRLQTGNDVFIYQSAIHHCHHLQGFGIGDAASIYHFAFNT